jgi:hypothetical protein
VDRSGATDLFLSWEAVAGAVDYHVWRDASPTFPEEVFAGASGGATSLLDGGAADGSDTRYYLVRAVNSCRWEGP